MYQKRVGQMNASNFMSPNHQKYVYFGKFIHSLSVRMDPPERTTTQKIEALRADLVAHPELLARFNEIHPPPAPGPTTLEEALRNSSSSDLATIPPIGPCYGLRYKFRLTCSQEARLSDVMHVLL